VIDAIVPEPGDGAHTDHDEAARLLGDALRESLDELEGQSGDDLRRRRRVRFRTIGQVPATR
jgi:acetyl-CoA carboxylase alpha subunit